MNHSRNLISMEATVNDETDAPVDTTLEDKIIKKDFNMRTALIRVSKKNKVTVENKELKVKPGDVVEYNAAMLVDTLSKWAKTKKGMRFYLIEHNEDSENVHFHIVIEFGKTSQCKFSRLKKMFPYGHIDTVKSSIRSAVQYLVHLNNPEKAQYEWDNVYTNAPAKLEIYKQPSPANLEAQKNAIINDIVAGKLKEHDIEKIPPEIYVKFATKIKNAFDYRRRLSLLDHTRNVQIIALIGPPRTGKSLLCKVYAEKMGKSICFSSSSNDLMESYGGEDILCVDDFNFEQMSIYDFIKMTDTHNNTSIKSRYHNKVFTGDTIFICSNVSVFNWYSAIDYPTLYEAVLKRIKYVLDFQDFKLAKGPFMDGVHPVIDEAWDREYNDEYVQQVNNAEKAYKNRLDVKNGVSKYTINRITNFKELDEETAEFVRMHFNYANNHCLIAVDCDETVETKYHYFDLNKYVDLGSDEKKSKEIVDVMATL